MITAYGTRHCKKLFEVRITTIATTRVILTIALLLISSHSQAWIAYGFKSGMSRFDVSRLLYENESYLVTDEERQTYAGPKGNQSKYALVYCATPQKLYLMRFRLDDSLETFIETKAKFEKRYGEPTSLNARPDFRNPEVWESVDIAFIWDLNRSETILLKHTRNGTSAEFQDLSVCE